MDSFTTEGLPHIPSTAETKRSLPTPAAGGDEDVALMSSVSGDRNGLYGGSGSLAVCDVEKLIAFLRSNPGRAKEWTSVLGVSDIEAYVRSLTPLVLRVDTMVTNFGYQSGAVVPSPSVLQAGTAALVDANGVPRVRCDSGNPLTPPQARSSSVEFTGKRWTGFTPRTIFVVTPSPSPVREFTVVDLLSGLFLAIRAGVPKPAPPPTPEPTPSPEPVPYIALPEPAPYIPPPPMPVQTEAPPPPPPVEELPPPAYEPPPRFEPPPFEIPEWEGELPSFEIPSLPWFE